MGKPGFDIAAFEGAAKSFEEGVVVDIRHPTTGKKLGLWVKVASYQSERVKKVQRQLGNAALRDQKRNPKSVATVDEIEEKARKIVASAVMDWNLTRDGKPVECTPANVLETISNPDLWFIGEQVDQAADDQASFIKA